MVSGGPLGLRVGLNTGLLDANHVSVNPLKHGYILYAIRERRGVHPRRAAEGEVAPRGGHQGDHLRRFGHLERPAGGVLRARGRLHPQSARQQADRAGLRG
eukprot:1094502-Prorocentrum_minimum.AAC.2